MKSLFIFCLSAFCWSAGQCEVISIDQGMVNGTILYSRDGKPFHAFYSIPYAEAPVGKLRFQPPKGTPRWEGVRNASSKGPICTQKQHLFDKKAIFVGQEDCLYLSVFVAELNSSRLLPVIMYIHGGAYRFGSGDFRGPEYFMDSDIVFVTFNHRLGLFGFLSAEDNVFSGNYGLKDQVAAMKWVKQNIKYFGGDPNSVTILGQSSGAASVHLHTLSPASKGLFHKAIIQSGTAYSLWAYHPRQKAAYCFKQLINRTICAGLSAEPLHSCIQNMDAYEFMRIENLYWSESFSAVNFRPSIEPTTAMDAFLTDDPRNMEYQNTSIPWIIGITSAEGLVELIGLRSTGVSLHGNLRSIAAKILPTSLHFNYLLNSTQQTNITDILLNFYTDEDTKEINAKNLCNIYSDLIFAMPCIKTILNYPGPKFVYYFDYKSKLNLRRVFNETNPVNVPGTGHGDDLVSLFKFPFSTIHDDKDVAFSKMLINYWTVFAAKGNPDQSNTNYTKWLQMTTNDIEYIHFSNNNTLMEKGLLKNRYNFWQTLHLADSTKR